MKPYIIGETAYNHEGDFSYMKKMIDGIAEVGLNAVKFHLMFNPESYMQKRHPLLKAEYEWLFTEEQWHGIFDYSASKALDIIALCDDIESIDFINKHHKGISAIELHAVCLNDFFMLGKAAEFPNKVILGIGGSTVDEIEYAVQVLKQHGKADILLMYGYQSYPTNYNDINLSKMLKIRHLFNLPVGYADHTAYDDPNNVYISTLAAAMGFNILEKHFTPDYGLERIDYHSAVGKELMLEIREKMELCLTVYGDGRISMSESELKYGCVGPMKKAIVAGKPIKKGEKLSTDNLWFKRTEEESSIKQNQFFSLIGLEAIRDIEEDEIIDFSKVKYEFKKAGFSELAGGLEEKR